jgi:hypothetical protein
LVRISTKVLRIVGVYTLVSVMFIYIRAKNGFVLVEVKVLILLHVMEQFNHNLTLFVSKGTITSILTFVHIVWMVDTELPFVPFRVI